MKTNKRTKAKPLLLPALATWKEFSAPSMVLATYCPQCGNVAHVARVHQRALLVDRRCPFCPGGRAPVLHVVSYQRMAPPVARRAKPAAARRARS